jgi:hypothetical protein
VHLSASYTVPRGRRVGCCLFLPLPFFFWLKNIYGGPRVVDLSGGLMVISFRH